MVQFYGKAYSGDKVFDPADLRFPVIDPSGVFLMTKKVSLIGQKMSYCVDSDDPKSCPCDEGESCNGEYCEVLAWCPSLGDKNVASPPSVAVTEKMEGLDEARLKILASISFPGIGDDVFVYGGSGAGSKFGNIAIGELLTLANPPIKIEELQDLGAIIGVSFLWNCDVATKCEPIVVVKRLDSGEGFVHKRAWHRRVDGKEVRDAYYMFGLRILIDSSGIGRQWSVALIAIQIGSGIALLRLASVTADFLMLWWPLYTKGRKEAYYKCKVEETGDLTDMQDHINLVKDQKDRREGMELDEMRRMAKRGVSSRFTYHGFGG